MRIGAAPFVALVLMAAASCTSIVGLQEVPTPVEAGDDGSSSGGTSGSGGGSTSGASSGADSTVGEGGDDGTTASSSGSSGADGSSSGSEAGSSSGTTSSSSGSGGAEGGPDGGDAGDGSDGNDGCSNPVENCFNGIDDNCNGLVDCADPQCTGGSTPVAECVPDPGGLTAGILSTASPDAGAACAAQYPTTTALYAGLIPGSCGAGSCLCGGGMTGTPTCSASLTSKGANFASCNLGFGTSVFSKANTDGCFTFSPALSSGTWYTLSTPTLSGGACNPSNGGAAAKNPPTWTTTNHFCSGAGVGAGCPSGHVCVPAAANHCVLDTGNQVCSSSSYSVINTTPYYTGYDDSGRACGCTCNQSGTCSGVVGFGSGSCGTLTAVGAGCQNGLAFDHADISAPNAPGCTAGATEGGSTSTTGAERTVCCLH